MATYNFEEVSIQHTKRWTDPVTGKKRQQTKKFYMTLNPFNKNEDGTVRTRQDIYRELAKQRDAWLASA
jgi:hypothetical protein